MKSAVGLDGAAQAVSLDAQRGLSVTFVTRAAKVTRTMITWALGPAGDGSRTVTVWTWTDGPDPEQQPPFSVPSAAAARAMVPDHALRVVDCPDWFAEEAWIFPGT